MVQRDAPPNVGGKTVPQSSEHSYIWRLPLEDPEVEEKWEAATLQVGNEVWVKPGSARCTMRWDRGKITGVNSRDNVSVDGMTRHILHIRRVYDAAETDGEDSLPEAAGGKKKVVLLKYQGGQAESDDRRNGCRIL